MLPEGARDHNHAVFKLITFANNSANGESQKPDYISVIQATQAVTN